jgi:murein DD-endopeptidase MepM/ murein hydrolase activator NlpD
MKKIVLLFFFLILAAAAGWYLYRQKFLPADQAKDATETAVTAAETSDHAKADRTDLAAIKAGDTYGSLMEAAGIDFATADEIYQAALPQYDLAMVRTGKCLELTYDKETGSLYRLLYKIDSEDQLCVEKIKVASSSPLAATTTMATEPPTAAGAWQASVAPIPYKTETRTAGGVVETSMYQAALDNDIDIRAIIELANAFQWTIDFALDPRQGDAFKFVFEERYLAGEYVMPGQILAGQYVNDGTKYEVYYFEETADNTGFFDEKGNSVQKMFLKAPVAFKYISSGFTTGLRYIKAFDIATGHRAVDYAAAAGTPIRAVGDGTVVSAGWNGAYGYMTSIRHNGTYTTNYAHQSKIAVKRGQKVKQGQIIGYVGSTGLSTGPHLHYEMVKNGVKVNPLKEVLPPGEPIREENRERFFEFIKTYQEQLNAAE